MTGYSYPMASYCMEERFAEQEILSVINVLFWITAPEAERLLKKPDNT